MQKTKLTLHPEAAQRARAKLREVPQRYIVVSAPVFKGERRDAKQQKSKA